MAALVIIHPFPLHHKVFEFIEHSQVFIFVLPNFSSVLKSSGLQTSKGSGRPSWFCNGEESLESSIITNSTFQVILARSTE